MLSQKPFTGFCLVLTAFFIATFWQTQTRSTSLLRRLTNTSAEVINLNPSLSGDGSQVAFESTADLAGVGGAQGFHAIKADVSAEPFSFAQIGGTRAVAPSQSQDGSRITFASYEDLVGQNADRNSEIFMLDGSALTQITKTTPADLASRLRDGNFQPSISDDGAFIAFSSNRDLVGSNSDLNFEIFLYDSASQTLNQITASQGTTGATDAKMAGDGSRVAYIQDSSANVDGLGSPNGTTVSVAGNRDLMLYNRATGLAVRIASRAPALSLTYGRAISDDGLRVVYSAETGENQSQVFLYDGRFDAVRQITLLGTREDDVPLQATISGDAKRITFSTRRNVIGGNGDRSVELYMFDIPTAQFSQLTDAPSTATAEVVSSLNDAGTTAVFNFPRVLLGSVPANNLANNSEVYLISIAARPASGTLTIANGAALGAEITPAKAVAPASIAIAQGSALASKTEHSEPLLDGSFPLSVAGTSVSVNGRVAQLLYVSPTQVNFVVPAETDSGTADVIVTNAEGFPSRTEIAIVPAAPGIFTVTGTGRGEAIILNAGTLVLGPFDPTKRNLRLIIFATGVRGSSQLSLTIAGHPLVVESIQKSPELPGLDEIHVLIPADLREAGTLNLVITADAREGNPVAVTFSEGSDTDIVINEMLADPPDRLAGDANHDGVRDGSQDEFIELVNTTESDLDISGYQLQTRGSSGTDTLRHRFAPGTVFPAGTALVVFGGGDPDPANIVFAGAQVVQASTGGLSLLNAGGVVTLRDPAGLTDTSLSYGGSTGRRGDMNQSLTRSPDITGSFVLHQSAPEGGGRVFSPGSRLDGAAFLSRPAILHILISPAFATLAVDEQMQFVGRAFDQTEKELSNVIFAWRSNNSAIATVDSNGLAKAIAAGTAEITASARGMQSAPTVITVPTPSPTPTTSPSPSPFPTASPSPSPSATPPAKIVISEFRTRGPNGASDEFIELYNNSDTATDVGGWKIKASSNAGTVTTRLTINIGTVIPPRGHFLASNSGGYSGLVPSDQVFSSGIANDGGIALTLPNDALMDQVGLSAGSAFREGMHLAPLPSDANQSYERKPGGFNGSTQDTGDNFNDLQLMLPSDPQNLSSGPTPGSSPAPSPSPSATPSFSPTPSPSPFESPSPSPTPTPAPTVTPTPSPSPSAVPSPSPTPKPLVVISEFRTRGPNGASDEFIEIYNNSPVAIDIAGWKIRASSGSGSISTRVTINSGMMLPAEGHFLATNSAGYSGLLAGDQTYSSGVANDGGIALTLPNDTVVDQVGMSAGSAFKEGMHLAPLPSDANQSYERQPGGPYGSSADTDDNFSDFHLLTPSDPQNLSSSATPGPSPTPNPSPSPSVSPTPTPFPSPSPTPTASPSPSPSPSPVTKVVISQIYGGGGNSGSAYRNDFIEIFNSGETSVNLAGWSVQYAGAALTTWSVTNLTSHLLAPGQYYLIQETSGGSSGALLPTPDTSGTITMSATAGKVALVNVSTPLTGDCQGNSDIIDLVGYGSTASCYRGPGPAPAPGNTTSAIRKDNGCTDSQNNASDFMAAPPDPRNNMSTTSACGGTIALASISAEYRNRWRELLALL